MIGSYINIYICIYIIIYIYYMLCVCVLNLRDGSWAGCWSAHVHAHVSEPQSRTVSRNQQTNLADEARICPTCDLFTGRDNKDHHACIYVESMCFCFSIYIYILIYIYNVYWEFPTKADPNLVPLILYRTISISTRHEIGDLSLVPWIAGSLL